MAMPEVKIDSSQKINLSGSLGHEAHYFGRDAFSTLSDALSSRTKAHPEFLDTLRKFVDYAHSDKTDIVHELHINGHRKARQLSEQLLGKWVGLAAEQAILDGKPMPNEADGARRGQLEGEAQRLEDVILLSHRGDKSVTLDENIVRIIADPKGDTVERLMDGLHDVTDTLAAGPGRAAVKLAPLAVAGSLLFSSCTGDYYFPTPIELPAVTTDPSITQTVPGMETPSPTDFQPALTPSGPETTPTVPRPYPTSLTVETAQQGIVAVVDAPAEITGLPEVQAIVAKHTQLARDKGLVFDHMAVKYAPADQRWFLVPVAADGMMIAGWLQIADPSSQSGFRYGEQPTWDSQYSPSTDTYQYGLPVLHDSANHFEVGFVNGFPVLIEVGVAPQYWNDVVEKTIKVVEGAVLPTENPTPPRNAHPLRNPETH